MPQRTDIFDLGAPRAHLRRGPARSTCTSTSTRSTTAAQRYAVDAGARARAPRRLPHHRQRLGAAAALQRRRSTGPCMRCLEPATPSFDVDSHEVHQPGAAARSSSRPTWATTASSTSQAWARDALALALPAQLTCRPDCAGLCPQCGANLNEDPDHAHEAEPGSALGEALRAEVRLTRAPRRYPSRRLWPSPSRSSRTRAPRSDARSTRSPLRR